MPAAEGLSALQGPAAEMSDEDSKATLDPLCNRTEELAALAPTTLSAQSLHLQHVHRYVELARAQLAG